MNKVIEECEFIAFMKDSCLYRAKNTDGTWMYIILYVDDVLLFGKETTYFFEVKRKLSKRYKLNDLGRVKEFLGVKYKRFSDRIEMNVESHIDKMLQRFNMTNCVISTVPAIQSVQLSKDDCPTTAEEREYMKLIPYRELVGSLIYISITLIAQVSCSINKLAKFMSNPGKKHWEAAKRVLAYLKGIKKDKLIFYKNTNDNKYI